MPQRLQPSGSGQRAGRRRKQRSRAGGVREPRTIPAVTPPHVAPESGPTLLGFPAEVPEEEDEAEPPAGVAPPDVATSSPALVVVRRADPFAAGALVLAGVAANVSLVLSWAPGEGPSGLSLVQRGVEALGSSAGAIQSGVWQPPVVVLSGGLLVLLGFLMLIPAHAHRLVGVLALIVALAAAEAVLLLVAESGPVDGLFGPGMWCAVAVPVLGVLGALKAMLTAPLVTLEPG